MINGQRQIIKKGTSVFLQFIIASFMGWLYEIATVYIIYREYFDRGVLHLPLCPIYGFGMIFVSLVLYKVRNSGLIFLGSAVITTSIELLVSYIAEYKYHWILWTYEGWPLNFQNRIFAVSSIIFGLMAVIFIKFIRPLIDRLCTKVKTVIIVSITVLLYAFCIVWEMRFLIG